MLEDRMYDRYSINIADRDKGSCYQIEQSDWDDQVSQLQWISSSANCLYMMISSQMSLTKLSINELRYDFKN